MELGQWIGIVYNMGAFQLPALVDYWSHDDLRSAHLIRTYMTQTRVKQVQWYLHISPPEVERNAAPDDLG